MRHKSRVSGIILGIGGFAAFADPGPKTAPAEYGVERIVISGVLSRLWRPGIALYDRSECHNLLQIEHANSVLLAMLWKISTPPKI